VLWPERDGELTSFLRWLTLTHAQRWKHAHDAVGHGHLYQGRFKSFPIQDDGRLLIALRYLQRNPLRAKLVERAEEWRWGSCFVRQHRGHALAPLLSPWPIDRPRGWLELVNQPQTAAEEKAVTLTLVTQIVWPRALNTSRTAPWGPPAGPGTRSTRVATSPALSPSAGTSRRKTTCS
jgi:hypothetical protein